ncbi:MAG: type 1 periplasmic binding fold superfamily protein [Saprospiraceae bacterium]|jgi:hypothetical protein|nr:type 1 periplasmic binding fold superfamily protein [Saprospiraceae bacterium]MBP9209908.1 type 1 periplasmic binding fold superfamily protein [Saprospiraceae bacterium]MBV6473104.1 hypothetical protein [Saprospiraceae bacterium]
MQNQKWTALLIVFSPALLWLSCSDDPIPNESELITSLYYELTDSLTGTNRVLWFKDLDGAGGQAPEFYSDTLSVNTVYYGSLRLLDESGKTLIDITQEILSEAEDHQFFYYHSGDSPVQVSYRDSDGNGYPVGLESRVLTNNVPGASVLRIILRHQPNKKAEGVYQGIITNAGGETDLQVDFTIITE